MTHNFPPANSDEFAEMIQAQETLVDDLLDSEPDDFDGLAAVVREADLLLLMMVHEGPAHAKNSKLQTKLDAQHRADIETLEAVLEVAREALLAETLGGSVDV